MSDDLALNILISAQNVAAKVLADMTEEERAKAAWAVEYAALRKAASVSPQDHIAMAQEIMREAAQAQQKQCSRCKQHFPATLEFFTPAKDKRFGLYSMCRECKNESWRACYQRKKAKRVAVIKPVVGTPDQCGSCGVTRGNILGDVDKATAHKYGYLCARCHQLVRDFQGDPERIRKVLDYVEQTR